MKTAIKTTPCSCHGLKVTTSVPGWLRCDLCGRQWWSKEQEKMKTTIKKIPCFVRMFKPQFAGLVEAGTKLQTVRPTPKRMPKPGDKISLRAWTGMPYRSKQRVLREAIISRVDSFSIDTFPTMRINDISLKYRSSCDEFARADGFEDYPALLDWFRDTHGLPFEGIVIHWSNVRGEGPPHGGPNSP